jgi:hypothetical protein
MTRQQEKAMAFDIRKYVASSDDPELQETYDIVNQLVNDAGDVTIRDLFTKTAEHIGMNAWNAIQHGKAIGFLNIDNKGCCQKGD